MVEITPKEPQPRRACKHGHSHEVEWRIWKGMISRCTSPKNPAWVNYGGRGIRVCRRWIESYDSFLADMGRRPSPGHELDRRDNNRGYTPSNCRWVSRKINSRNRRSARIVTYRGRSMCLSEACELAGLPWDTVAKRIDGPAKWSVEKALTTPVRYKAPDGCAFKKPPQVNSTGFKGVKKRRNKYVARVAINHTRYQSPQFDTPEEAHAWYNKKIEEAELHDRRQCDIFGSKKRRR